MRGSRRNSSASATPIGPRGRAAGRGPDDPGRSGRGGPRPLGESPGPDGYGRADHVLGRCVSAATGYQRRVHRGPGSLRGMGGAPGAGRGVATSSFSATTCPSTTKSVEAARRGSGAPGHGTRLRNKHPGGRRFRVRQRVRGVASASWVRREPGFRRSPAVLRAPGRDLACHRHGEPGPERRRRGHHDGDGLRLLAEDPMTEVIVLVAKHPDPAVAERFHSILHDLGKPVVVRFLGVRRARIATASATPAPWTTRSWMPVISSWGRRCRWTWTLTTPSLSIRAGSSASSAGVPGGGSQGDPTSTGRRHSGTGSSVAPGQAVAGHGRKLDSSTPATTSTPGVGRIRWWTRPSAGDGPRSRERSDSISNPRGYRPGGRRPPGSGARVGPGPGRNPGSRGAPGADAFGHGYVAGSTGRRPPDRDPGYRGAWVVPSAAMAADVAGRIVTGDHE